VTVKNNATVVIGGLIRDTSERDGQGIPWLSDIPVLGYLFGSVDKAKKREELIIMIQPTVVATEADQVAVDNRERSHVILAPDVSDAVKGTIPSLNNTIPWSPNSADLLNQPSESSTTTTTTTIVSPAPAQPQSQSPAPYNSKGIPIPSTSTTTTITTEPAPAPRMTSPQLEPVNPGPATPSGPVTPQQ